MKFSNLDYNNPSSASDKSRAGFEGVREYSPCRRAYVYMHGKMAAAGTLTGTSLSLPYQKDAHDGHGGGKAESRAINHSTKAPAAIPRTYVLGERSEEDDLACPKRIPTMTPARTPVHSASVDVNSYHEKPQYRCIEKVRLSEYRVQLRPSISVIDLTIFFFLLFNAVL